MSRISVGTSGWTYKGWRGPFYPERLAQRLWLKHYSSVFSTTEINGSFYRTPELDTVRKWRSETPKDFTFAWKASKFITHWKRLTPKSENSLELMETRLKVLGPKTGTVLFQLPPQFSKNVDRLSAFLKLLKRRHRYTFEFRHKSWYHDEVLELLSKHNVALCISDHRDAPSPWSVTADHVYIRGHGPGGHYSGSYSARTLRRWADLAAKWKRQGRDVAVYFDNDQKAAAPLDAQRLLDMLAKQ